MVSALRQRIWDALRGRTAGAARGIATSGHAVAGPTVEIEPSDPLMAYFQRSPSAVELDSLSLDSPALRAMREAGVKLAVPLVSQGELVGVLSLGPRLSDQDYSADDRMLLTNLATQAAPAVRVAQLVRQQQAAARERERIENELKVARLIQQTLLPHELPRPDGWEIAAHYQPAREVGGDFYDFLALPDGEIAIVVGDVTDKGVPAALVMASTRSVLRGALSRLGSPGEVLSRANEILHGDIPPKMFVTCLCVFLQPATGRLRVANAGHNLPYRRSESGVDEVRATGMPLGLLPDMTYEETETIIRPGETVVLYSDGIVEAHGPGHDMLGFDRLADLIAERDGGDALIEHLLDSLARFVGPTWEQEDDVTLVALRRLAHAGSNGHAPPDLVATGEHLQPPERTHPI